MVLKFFRRLGVQSKVLSMVLAASLLSLLLTGIVSYAIGSRVLTKAATNQLVVLRNSRDGNPVVQVRALADNARLWTTVIDLMRDPENALPAELRASIVSVGMAVQREMQRDAPDFDFLIGVNEDIAAGLSGQG